jgi:hypothetical protein
MRPVTVPLSSVLILLIGLYAASAHPLSQKDLNELCSEFPFNAACKGEPIALDDRPGEAGVQPGWLLLWFRV